MDVGSQLLRVLLVEDNTIDADLIRQQLLKKEYGIHLEIVPTIALAQDKLAQVPLFDLVLTDLRLPDGTGLDLLAEIRNQDLSLAVVIITGAGDQEAAVAALKAGADDYLVKSLDLGQKLPALLKEAFERFKSTRAFRSNRLTVLYAEPNSFDVDLTRRHLAKQAPHIHFEAVHDGHALLTKINNQETSEKYDALLLDYNLPGMNAIELVKILRQQMELTIPIVLVTGHGTEEIAVHAIRLGVNDYLVKRDGYLHRLPVILENVTKQAELIRQEKRYRNLFDSMRDAMIVANQSRIVLDANQPALRNIFGYEISDIVGQSTSILYADQEQFEKVGGEVYHNPRPAEGKIIETSFLRKSGEEFSGELSALKLRNDKGEPIGNIVIIRDITEHLKAEKKRLFLEEQLQQAAKMESLGQLAGGVAHDYNNMLGVIIGYTEMAKRKIKEDNPLSGDLAIILKAAERSATITRQLLAYARKQTINPQHLDLNQTLESMLQILRRLIGENISLLWQPGTIQAAVKLDPSQLDQILTNLCVNARDAISGSGQVTIKTEQVNIDEAYCMKHPNLIPGQFVMLAVSDNGCGIEESNLSKVFEPFFTTKEKDQGTGLGLATVYGIVKQNQGLINIYSQPGHGTTIEIYFKTHATLPQKIVSDTEPDLNYGAGETVLLVDDDLMVLAMEQKMLQELGYKVLIAPGPAAAIGVADGYPEKIDLLITDVVMPEMNGRQLAENIHARYPEIKVLFMSGYTADVIAHREILDEGVNYIQKPVTMDSLSREIRATIG